MTWQKEYHRSLKEWWGARLNSKSSSVNKTPSILGRTCLCKMAIGSSLSAIRAASGHSQSRSTIMELDPAKFALPASLSLLNQLQGAYHATEC